MGDCITITFGGVVRMLFVNFPMKQRRIFLHQVGRYIYFMSYFLGGKNQAFLINHKILKFLWPSGPFPALSDPPSASWSKNTSLALFGEFLLVIFTDGPLSST